MHALPPNLTRPAPPPPRARPAATVVVPVPGQLAGDKAHQASCQRVLHELVACTNLVLFHARLLTNGYMLWVHE